MLRVAQLVNHQVAQKFRLKKQQAVVDTDSPARRMAAPARSLAAHVHLLVGTFSFERERFQPESGKITLSEMVQLYIDHIEIHIQQMKRNNYDWEKANESALI